MGVTGCCAGLSCLHLYPHCPAGQVPGGAAIPGQLQTHPAEGDRQCQPVWPIRFDFLPTKPFLYPKLNKSQLIPWKYSWILHVDCIVPTSKISLFHIFEPPGSNIWARRLYSICSPSLQLLRSSGGSCQTLLFRKECKVIHVSGGQDSHSAGINRKINTPFNYLEPPWSKMSFCKSLIKLWKDWFDVTELPLAGMLKWIPECRRKSKHQLKETFCPCGHCVFNWPFFWPIFYPI